MYDTMTFIGNEDINGNDTLVIKGNNFWNKNKPNKLFGINLLTEVTEINHLKGYVLINGICLYCEEAKEQMNEADYFNGDESDKFLQ